MISEKLSLRLSDFLREYMEPDEYCAACPGHSYPVHSVYFNTDDWKIFCCNLFDEDDDLELRLRYYGRLLGDTAFVEIKRHHKDLVWKQRCRVKREALPLVLSGQMPGPSELCSPAVAEEMAMRRFLEMSSRLNARPQLHLRCDREAYESSDQRCRVTLDHEVVCSPCVGEGVDRMNNPRGFYDREVAVLKIKFQDHYPDWCRQMVEIFSLS